MDRNNRALWMFCVLLLISSSISFGGPLKWAKKGLYSLWSTYKWWGVPRPARIDNQKVEDIPRPRCINTLMMELEGKKFEEFRYDISHDNDLVHQLRKQLHIAGVYLSNDSDVNVYKTYLNALPMLQQYNDNGFDINIDNTVSKCLQRLFTNIIDTDGVTMQIPSHAWIQLLWELEASLPQNIDTDITGEKFIAVIRNMFPPGQASSLGARFVSAPFIINDAAFLKLKLLAGDYIQLWIYYTLRFRNSAGLLEAYRKVRMEKVLNMIDSLFEEIE